MSIKEIANACPEKARATRVSVYTIHTNKYIEYIPNILPTTSTSCHNKILEKARSRNIYFENGPKTEDVHM